MASCYKHRAYKYRQIVAIDLVAEVLQPIELPSGLVKVKGSLWLGVVPGWLSDVERHHLHVGLTSVATQILGRVRDDCFTVIRVLCVRFNPCHYCPEELAPAVVGWAGRAFGFGVQPVAAQAEAVDD